MFVVVVVWVAAAVGSFPLLVVGPAAASSGPVVFGAQITEPTTTVAGTVATTTAPPAARRSADRTTRTVTRALVVIAVVIAVMASVYFWYTIPSRRKRLAEQRR